MVTVWRGTAELPHQHRAGLQPLAALVTHLLSPIRLQKPQCGLIVAAKGLFLDPPDQVLSSRSRHRLFGRSWRNSAVQAAFSPFSGRPARRSISAAIDSGKTDRAAFFGATGMPRACPNHAPFPPEVQPDL